MKAVEVMQGKKYLKCEFTAVDLKFVELGLE